MNDRLVNPFSSSGKGFEFYAGLEPALETLPLVHSQSDHPRSLIKELQTITLEDLLGAKVSDRLMAQAVRAGLLLVVDAWNEAHEVAQDLDSVEGSYWHGIVHRREPDAGNAKYWFRRVGTHPIFARLGEWDSSFSPPVKQVFSKLIPSGSWDPFMFIDVCVGNVDGDSSELCSTLVTLQAREIRLLLEHCIRHATDQ